jgi:hypothetical protein
MADQWTERMHCPDCRKTGVVSLNQGKGDDMPTAAVSDGFKVINGEYGPIFHCEACAVQAEQ